LVAATAAFSVALTNQSSTIDSLQRQIAAQKVALGAPTSAATNLHDQVASLSNEVSHNSATIISLQTGLSTATSNLAQICNATSVSNERSNLNGEETGSGIYSQYYGDMFSVISSICGNDNNTGG